MCKDCFRHSNSQQPLWFAKPCSVRHELVFAKQNGYCYWPAKVLKVKDNKYDVRFFGGKHERALIKASNVKPIDTDRKLLNLNMSSSFKKSLEELQKYQENLFVEPNIFSYEAECLQMENTLTVKHSLTSTNLSGKLYEARKFIQNQSNRLYFFLFIFTAINSSTLTNSSGKSYESKDLIKSQNNHSRSTKVANKMINGQERRKRKLVDVINEEEDNNNVQLKFVFYVYIETTLYFIIDVC